MKNTITSSMNSEVLQSSLDIQENYQKMVSRIIYEDIGQLLSLAKMQLNTLHQLTTGQPDTIIVNTGNLIGKSIRGLRILAQQMTAKEIMQKGFAYALERELGRLNDTGICKTGFAIKGKFFRLDNMKELVVFSLFQKIILRLLRDDHADSIMLVIHYLRSAVHLKLNFYLPVRPQETTLNEWIKEQIAEKLESIDGALKINFKKQLVRINISIKNQLHDTNSAR